MRRVLFIARVFPPAGGGGIQRPVKLVQHLVDFGWVARVIAAPPSDRTRDESMLADIPPQVELHRLAGAVGVRAPSLLRALKLLRPYRSLSRFVWFGDDGFADLAE